ncbi:MAG TPA: M48 family metalloprotease, partial [Candidatus Marinimicrobia bacterium]|nr:M48 family metalloprotease [Candidatus Neomarinimicrobiota bacterium]
MKRFILIILVVSVLIVTVFAEESVVIKRENTHFRQGPGSYYPLIGMLQKGVQVAVVGTQSGWMNIQCAGQIGWISENAVIASDEPTGSILTGSISVNGSMMISRASASGAVKGFAQKFVNFHDGDPAFIEQYDVELFTPAEFQRFRQETFRGRDPDKIRKRYKRIKSENTDHSISLQDEKIGLAAASRIAASGLVANQSQLKYINLVGNIVLENTDMYDYPFKFYILKDSRPSAYAIPNGMIFVTSGLLELLQDEAELAVILAHEISHVVQKHGAEEIAKRKTMIVADEGFNELDQEIVTEDTIADELDLIALNCYETATKR